MKQLRLLLREVHRRSVWHTLAVFIGGGWATLQVIDLFIERGFAPEWVFGGALVVLAIGLPVVLTTAFMQGGRERAPAAPSDTATTAIDAYERYLEYPFFDAVEVTTHIFGSSVHERLGALYEAAGDSVRAAEHYGRFAELCSQADPDLQPRVARARARSEALRSSS